MKRDPSIIRAERLRVVVQMPEYRETIGAWIDEAYNDALHRMKSAKVDEFQTAQGYFAAIEDLKTMINAVFEAERRALAKINKQTTEGHDGQ